MISPGDQAAREAARTKARETERKVRLKHLRQQIAVLSDERLGVVETIVQALGEQQLGLGGHP